MNDTEPEFRGGQQIVKVAGALAAAGVIALVIGAFVNPDRFFQAYLAAYSFAVSVAAGALVFLMIGHAMRASWPTLLRRITEGIVATFPLLAVLFIPILFGLRRLYPWLRIETIPEPAAREIVHTKLAYLNTPGFVVRTVAYFLVFILVSRRLLRLSREKDRKPEVEVNHRLHVTSGVLLPLVALAISFASFDWIMSLQPTWFSTMFPVYYFADGFLGALSLLTILTAAADRAYAIRGINDSHYYALGRLLLAFVIFWAYIAFFQLMLTWIANRPEEVTFYLDRIAGGWYGFTVVVVTMHFVVPFFVLLNYDIKRRRGPLTLLAAWILASCYLDIHWLVVPAGRAAPVYSLVDLGAILAIGGVTVVYGVIRSRGRPLVPIHDPALPQARAYESL